MKFCGDLFSQICISPLKSGIKDGAKVLAQKLLTFMEQADTEFVDYTNLIKYLA